MNLFGPGGVVAVVVVVAVILIVVAVASVMIARARRLDALHVRVDAARAALVAVLDRRAAVVHALAAGPATVPGVEERHALRAAARTAEQAGAGEEREVAENDLVRLLDGLRPVGLPGDLAAELADADARVVVARRVHNDAVRDTRALRGRRMVRMLHLAGSAPYPRYFEIVEPTIEAEAVPAAPAAAEPEPEAPADGPAVGGSTAGSPEAESSEAGSSEAGSPAPTTTGADPTGVDTTGADPTGADSPGRRGSWPPADPAARALASSVAGSSGSTAHHDASGGHPTAAAVVTARARDAARVLARDVDGRVLLLGAQAPGDGTSGNGASGDGSGPAPSPGAPAFWFAPGGGVEAGERPAVAAARLFTASTGITAGPGDLEGPVWRRDVVFASDGVTYGAHEFFFVLHLREARAAVDVAGAPAAGSRPVVAARWWTPTELATTLDVVHPPALAALVDDPASRDVRTPDPAGA